jgi:glutamyl-tRNA reductase
VSTTGEGAALLVVGLSRDTAPVHIRERAALGAPVARHVLRALRHSGAVDEAVAMSTCNRTEVYASVPADRAADAPSVIRETVSCHTRISREELVQLGFARYEEDATEHLFGVIAGLDSTVLGEPEIVAQTRAAAALAKDEGMLGALLGGLFDHGMAAGRRVRASTAITRGATSVSSVAVDLAQSLLEDLPNRPALVIGAGKIASAVTQRLNAAGLRQIAVANRSQATALALSRAVGGRAVSLDELPDELTGADLVVCATAAPETVVSRRELAAASRGRQESLVVLDLAVPRDVEPAAHDLPGIVLRDIDEIQRIAAANLDDRRRELPRAWSIVRSEARRHQSWRAGLASDRVLTELRRRAEDVRRAELERVLLRWPSADDEELARLDAITRSLVNKLLHQATSRIREAGTSDKGRAQLDALSELFGLSDLAAARQIPARGRISVVVDTDPAEAADDHIDGLRQASSSIVRSHTRRAPTGMNPLANAASSGSPCS